MEVFTFPNGLRVATERTHARSVTVSCWVETGSRFESPVQLGSSHFLEHLLFRGTGRRDRVAISHSIEEVGGELNAFTSREYTCCYARVPQSELGLAIDLVADLVMDPSLPADQVEPERTVVLQEIAQSLDTPNDAIYDLIYEALFPGHSLAQPAYGSSDSVLRLTRGSLADYHRDRYRPAAMAVAIVGPVDHQEAVERLGETTLGRDSTRGPETAWRRASPPSEPLLPILVHERQSPVVHVLLAARGVSYGDPNRPAVEVLSAILAGLPTALIPLELRDRPVRCALDILADGRNGQFSDDLVARSIRYLRGRRFLDWERTDEAIMRFGRHFLLGARSHGIDEDLAELEAVDAQAVANVAHNLLARPVLCAIGPISPSGMGNLLEERFDVPSSPLSTETDPELMVSNPPGSD
ncbi:MAG: insulinase family protein [Chloroflexi bacterium]|nr:MAG: insulinase family protein [Chloroflexota bacterium]